MEKRNLSSKKRSGRWDLQILCFTEFVKLWEVAGI